MKILVLNSGSSSIKYQLFDMPNESPICSGLVDRIGLESSTIKHKTFIDAEEDIFQISLHLKDHEAGLELVTQLLTDPQKGVLKNVGEVEAIGHRVVHGGEQFASTALITKEVKNKIRALFELAPLHNPPNYTGIEVAERIFPTSKQVAVFDTAFHQSMPPRAYRFAIPKEMYFELGIRAYGFHGSSHQYVSKKAIEYLKNDNSKIITIHLGNGSSMAAIKNGKSIDTSMGLGPMGGLMMGTRCGDIDPSIIFYLINEKGFGPKEVNELLNKKSGMLGVAGYSDMRDVKKAIEKGDKEAKLAYELYAYRIQKYIGAYAASMNGLDAIVFTAGIGENDPDMRAAVCMDMDFLGIQMDPLANQKLSSEIREVNTVSSKTKILVIPTNEELEIGQQTYSIVKGEKT
ncbi:Acetate kinase [Indibacter alkaliphilus LW1]|uniref:Acetate kinase n=1 Tax=Indibacter alkaliphilus (strain CCUG 57479 / KCTC 22604 / LW1) TaxID=1189612 RepID=S2DY09_INDAL|nr:acetate kinase [Indibacter alkaliphilus]EOZ97021.1 Acetate kinase [Indibacter alkaliphilus LW1]